MFKKNKGFQNTKMGYVQKYYSYIKTFKNVLNIYNFIKLFIIIFCFSLVLYSGNFLIKATKDIGSIVVDKTIETVTDFGGREMKKDKYGNINITLIGVGGKNHAGGFLADAIMVISWNPSLGAITMISIPRDLYVNDRVYVGKINGVFASAYHRLKDIGDIKEEKKRHELRLSYASDILSRKLEDITGLEIPYYAVVDFQRFEELIDGMGGIEINVTERLYDNKYPLGNLYTTFKVEKGLQIFDGETALKYARSRYSTSDFDRSLRQQQIIKAIKEKLFSQSNMSIFNIYKLTDIYNNYTNMVHTNISKSETLGMFKYINKLNHILSFNYSTQRSQRNFKTTDPGSFLYTPNRDNFNGASVMIPIGGSSSNISFYEYTRNFAFYIAHNQRYLIENPSIQIKNAIDPKDAKQLKKKSDGHAMQIAVKLKKYGFNIISADNTKDYSKNTQIHLSSNEISYPHTINILKDGFISIDSIKTGQLLGTGIDMVIIIGSDYLQKIGDKKFNYDK